MYLQQVRAPSGPSWKSVARLGEQPTPTVGNALAAWPSTPFAASLSEGIAGGQQPTPYGCHPSIKTSHSCTIAQGAPLPRDVGSMPRIRRFGCETSISSGR